MAFDNKIKSFSNMSKNDIDNVIFHINLLTFHEEYKCYRDIYGNLNEDSKYVVLINTIKHLIFSNPNHRKIKKVLLHIDNNKAIIMNLNEFLFHLFLWRPNILLGECIESADLYNLSIFSSSLLGKIIEKIGSKFSIRRDKNGDLYKDLDIIISEIIYSFVDFSTSYDKIAANTFSLYDCIQLADRNNDFNEIINFKLTDNISFNEAEDLSKDFGKILNSVVTNDKKSQLTAYLNTNVLNTVQLVQMFGFIGPRSNIDKTIIPKMIKDGYINGMGDPAEIYVDSIMARLAYLLKHSLIGISGYLSRKFDLLCNGTYIDSEIDDCGTSYYLDYTVYDKRYLMVINKKNMIMEDGSLYTINGVDDVHLLGKKIKLRSSTVCKLPRGHVCKTCYGNYSQYRTDINPGGLPSITIANTLSGISMSAKHKTSTSTIRIKNALLDELFDYDNGDYLIKKNYDYNKIKLVFKHEFIMELLDRSNENNTDDNFIIRNVEDLKIRRYVLNKNTMVEELIEDEIEIKDGYIVLSNELINSGLFETPIGVDEAMISLDKVVQTDNDVVFSTIFITEEVSRYLGMLKSTLERSKDKLFTDYNEIVQQLIKILLDAGINSIELSTIEIIVYNLMRDPNNYSIRPDFCKKDAQYIILSSPTAILESNIYGAISFEKIKSTFSNVHNYTNRNKGIFENLFKTSPLKFEDFSGWDKNIN